MLIACKCQKELLSRLLGTAIHYISKNSEDWSIFGPF